MSKISKNDRALIKVLSGEELELTACVERVSGQKLCRDSASVDRLLMKN